MPVKIPSQLPAMETLQKENIFVMGDQAALKQDIREQRIAILNIMPTKITTEIQLLRLLGNSPLQVEITLLHPKSHKPKNTPQEHLTAFYKTFDDISSETFDGLIITGAPIEHLDFQVVDYWQELTEIMDWERNHVTSTLYLCWGAQAGLYYHYGIPKYPLPSKKFGVFPHKKNTQNTKLLRGFDDTFFAPHSRHTEIKKKDIKPVKELDILSESPDAGVYLVASKDGSQVFVTGHPEYDPLTLHQEYVRDRQSNNPIQIPENYYPEDDPNSQPVVTWRAHANLFFSNWLNYHVYQETSFEDQKKKCSEGYKGQERKGKLGNSNRAS